MRATVTLLLAFAAVLAGCVAGPLSPSSSGPGSPAASPLSFVAVHVNHGGFEPRVAVAADGTRWVSTQDDARREAVFLSTDGGRTWLPSPTQPNVTHPCCDNEIAVTPTGRVLTSIINGSVGTTKLDIRYSDDGGRTWNRSQGNELADQDRQWLAVGPVDPQTGKHDVYLLWHNLGSGAAYHEMWVSTSRDGGATFDPPVAIAPPGTQAWFDLQCADSGGPSNIVANPTTGQVYAIFGTRSSALGGCGASATQRFEINVVAATRTWVATSTDRGRSWNLSLAVDDSAAGNIVGMQVNAGALDSAGNLYLVYPESPQPYPNYDGAAVKYTWAPPDLSTWHEPVTVEPTVAGGNQPGAGHILTQIAVGDPGNVALFYLTGDGNGNKSLWYPTVAVTHDGLSAHPNFTIERVNGTPAWQGTASQLMGVCNPLGDALGPASGPPNTVLNGLACGRSSDVLGQALDPTTCHPVFTWVDSQRLDNETGGTYVTLQTGGPGLCDASG